ncbi:MAG: MFS transporter [Muribaculaceae bacterium]|nr:MFS transporter [Muribaculaceae bacterium]
MKFINTGKGKITLLTLLAVWSISLVVDLPGLAITPVMSDIDKIFPHASHLEIQLLSILPNFCILPFILLAGKMSMSRSKLTLICIGMAIFLAAGIACFFAKSLIALIVISCFIGVGCGIVIPLAAGVIADLFVGHERMTQMGIKSGIANFSLIIATLVVGWLGTSNWHLPFIVYLIPIVPLVLAPFLSKKYLEKTAVQTASSIPNSSSASSTSAAVSSAASTSKSSVPSIRPTTKKERDRSIIGIMVLYFTITCCTIVVSYYVPFAMQDDGLSSTWSGIVTSIFFLFITLAGFSLTKFVGTVRNSTSWLCLVLMIGGLVLMAMTHALWTYIIGVVLVGAGYGIMQPLFYNKAAVLSPNTNDSTRTLSLIMTANYFGTAVAPLIMTGIKDLFHLSGHVFAFWLGAIILAIPLVICLIKRNSYVFYASLKDC